MFAPVAVIGVIHIIAGLSALFAPGSTLTTGMYGLMASGASPAQVAITLIAVGFLAITARLSAARQDIRMFMITPQQIVLLVQAIGVLVVIANGYYPDGYHPANTLAESRWFILGDQAPWLVLCMAHVIDMMFGHRITLTRVQYENELAEKDREVQVLRNEVELNSAHRAWQNFTKDMQHKPEPHR
jgi:hypothetical protein